jgi:mannose-6-phosphate isomerase
VLPQTAKIAAVPLPTNLVWRSYSGGKVLREFRKLPAEGDNLFPEDWLASTVRARNGANSQAPDEGFSHLGNGRRPLASALAAEPAYWYGGKEAKRQSMGVLWKLLDSSVRLQFQAHPDAMYARQHLNSNAGKTECWYILGTRGPDACVYLGFQRPPSREAWKRIIAEQRADAMIACFDPIPVQAGDCYVVPAGTPHAIGAGVFMVELMEPTDWVVRCETVNAGVTLPPEACFMGLDLERCLDVFDYSARSLPEVRKAFQQVPGVVNRAASFTEEEIIGKTWHEFYRLHRLRGTGEASWAGEELMLLICVNGSGELTAGDEVTAVHAGETRLLPGAARKWHWHSERVNWELLLAKLPVKTV